MAYSIQRPILLQCNRLPNGGFKPIMSSAKTMKELKIDIVAMTPFSANDLSKFQIVCNTNTLNENSTIPLFSESTGITNENDERISSLIANYPNNPKGAEYICISMAETAKNTASGGRTISECCAFIEKADKVDLFKEKYSCAPEAASLRNLERFINECIINAPEPAKTVQLSNITVASQSELDALRRTNETLTLTNNSLRIENARLKGIIEGYNKARNDDDDDDDDDPTDWANSAVTSTASPISVDPRKLAGA